MPDWSSPLEQQRQGDIAVALAWLSVGVALHNHLTSLSFDWAILTGKRARRWPQAVFIALKVFWWIYIGVSFRVVFYPSERIDCRNLFYFVEFLMGAVNVCCSVLLACRTIVVYQARARKIVTAAVGALTLGLFTAWMVGVPDIKAEWIEGAGRAYENGACVFVEVPSRYGVKYAVTIAYDLIILCLTINGVARMNISSRLGDVLISQGIVYFLATLAVNAVVTGLTLAQLSPTMSIIAAIPSSCISMIAATRLYMDLTEEGRGARVIDSRDYAERSRGFLGLRKRLFGAGAGAGSDGSVSKSSNMAQLNVAKLQHEVARDEKDSIFISTMASSEPAQRPGEHPPQQLQVPVLLSQHQRKSSNLGNELGGVSIRQETTVDIEIGDLEANLLAVQPETQQSAFPHLSSEQRQHQP